MRRGASHDSQRTQRHADAKRRAIVRLSFRTLQRGNAGRDALRRKRTQSIRNGMRRGASHDSQRTQRHSGPKRRTIVRLSFRTLQRGSIAR
ncbi:DUF1534 domain-containing protein [Pseudomonas sp. KBS0707]|nr:hypothetical protein DND36_27130 [Pseudomonas savastanoi pv. glycinea]QDV99801.1 DUF1534 domain-containing protein [Pseudomonas sp. KBS0707]